MKQIKFFLTICSLMSLTALHAQTFWDINGNGGTTPANFVGTLKSEPLNLATTGIINVTLLPKNGFVGIGTQKPNWNLHLHTNPKYDFLVRENAFQMTNEVTGIDANKDGFIIYQHNTQLLMQQWENDLFKIRTPGGGMTIDPEGDVGFGTDIPHQEIHVVDGNILITKYSGHGKDDIMRLKSDGSPNGSIMFGEYATDDCRHGVWGIEYLSGVDNAYGLNFWKPYFPCQTGEFGNYFLFLHNNGNIGIGTKDPAEKLTVNGKICAKEVRVALSGAPCWPDFVFSKDYKLLSLPETEQYIKENGHLPEIPSAAEVDAGGIELGEMNALLLKKIEELTLHLIELQKQLEELKADSGKGGE